MARPKKYPDELIARGVRLALESERPIAHIAADLGIASETLRRRVRQAEADQGLRPGLPTTSEREEIRQLRRENFELRRANEILKSASVFFAKELDEHRTK
jgi:transposase